MGMISIRMRQCISDIRPKCWDLTFQAILQETRQPPHPLRRHDQITAQNDPAEEEDAVSGKGEVNVSPRTPT